MKIGGNFWQGERGWHDIREDNGEEYNQSTSYMQSYIYICDIYMYIYVIWTCKRIKIHNYL